ncbi:unnamed protein product, partial [marine sediment metagenome]
MSIPAEAEQVEQMRVICPHCKKALIVSIPVMKQAPSPPRPEESSDGDGYIDRDGPISEEEMRFRERVVNKILSKEFELPLLPHVALKVIRLTNDATSSMQDLAKVIMTDQMMTSKIIRIANSPVYAGTMEITNIKQALVRVGQGEVRNLMLAVSLGSKVFKSGMYSKLAKMLWEHAVGVAFAARVIAHGLHLDREQAFLCGLMHDLGKMVMLDILENCQRK